MSTDLPREEKPKKHIHISQLIWMSLAIFGWMIAVLEWIPPKESTGPLGGGLSGSGSKPTPKSTPTTKPTPPTPSATSTPSSTPTASPLINGTFVGSDVKNQFGTVQVQVTIVDSKITDVTALKYPNSGRSQQISQSAIPVLIQQTLTAQSSNIDGVSGASYTSQSFYDSLSSALTKAGL